MNPHAEITDGIKAIILRRDWLDTIAKDARIDALAFRCAYALEVQGESLEEILRVTETAAQEALSLLESAGYLIYDHNLRRMGYWMVFPDKDRQDLNQRLYINGYHIDKYDDVLPF